MCLFIGSSAFAGLSPFPLSANQRGTVTCLENPAFSYDIFLPQAYSTNGTALPILYTANAGGGGMVPTFLVACSKLNVIFVGLTGSRNGVPWDTILREIYAVTRDVRQRVNYDPTAEFAGGFSGGGVCSYMFSRVRAQHTSGVLEMAGWLARGNIGSSVHYYGNDRLLTNLLVARLTGSSDSGVFFYNAFDGTYLATCHTVIQDWTFDGGHGVPPNLVLSNSLSWLVSHRVPAGPDDRSNALAQANDWQARIAVNERESVLRECVSNLLIYPRSWIAYQAELTLDQLMTNYTAFRSLNVSNLAQGDFASDLFYHYARGAALNADWSRYNSCMKALTGISQSNGFTGTITNDGILVTVPVSTTNGIIYITTTTNDRAGDVYSLLTNYNHYPSPQLLSSQTPTSDQLNLFLNKDSPGLTYFVQSRSNLVNDTWHDLPAAAVDTATVWSADVNFLSETDNNFIRVRATPLPATSLPWTLR